MHTADLCKAGTWLTPGSRDAARRVWTAVRMGAEGAVLSTHGLEGGPKPQDPGALSCLCLCFTEIILTEPSARVSPASELDAAFRWALPSPPSGETVVCWCLTTGSGGVCGGDAGSPALRRPQFP